MSDDDPFADLGETLTDDADSVDADSPSEDSEPPADEPTASSSDDAGSDPDRAEPESEANDRRDPITDAAFSYDDAEQRPFYARPETIDEFDSWLNYELERDLHDRGYQNIVVREMTDALLRAVVEEDLLDDVARRFERARESASGESE